MGQATRDGGAQPQNIWLAHLAKSSERDPRLVELEDRIRSELETVVSRLVRDAATNHGLSTRAANAAGVNLVVQQALNLQREHSPGSGIQMVASLLGGDPALAPVLAGLNYKAVAASVDGLRRHLWAERRDANRRAALAGAMIGIAAMLAFRML